MNGETLGAYRILEPLGKGGMGEVYRAHDPTLKRDVAIKVLPAELAADPDRLARLEREAHSLAALNHPNVATIYGLEEVEEDDGTSSRFLVLELVEGATLEERLRSGPLEVERALEIAVQIARGLEAAHDEGIIHRDLKPGNIKITPDGLVKVLDFGLAKPSEAVDEAAGDEEGLTRSPTVAVAGTEAGVILGTAAYMSPEQARGKVVDQRTDIWSFGCVLYEMLTAQKTFAGDDAQETLAAILRDEPDRDALPAKLPLPLRVLLLRCLRKDPRRRVHAIADVRIEIEDSTDEGSTLAAPAASGPGWPRAILTALGLTALALALGFVVGRAQRAAVGPESSREVMGPETRTMVDLPDTAPLALGTRYPLIGFESPALAISDDGRHLVYVGRASGGGTLLYHRDLTRFEDPRAIAGTEGAHHAFFSPDSQELGFLTQDRVKKVSLDGSAPTTLCRARAPVKGTWIADTIYFSERQGAALGSVPATGGQSSVLFAARERFGKFGSVSDVLPGGRAAVISVRSPDSISFDYSEIWVVSLDDSDDSPLNVSGFDARYVPSGHLVFARGRSLLAAPFDLESLEVTGEPMPVLEGVALDSIFGKVHATFADNGTVAFVPGGDLASGRLAWRDRQGNEGILDVPERVYGVFDLAPDDARFAVHVADVQDYVWIWGAAGGGRSLARSKSVGWPVWSPDGTSLALHSSSPESAVQRIVIDDLRGGAARDLLSAETQLRPGSWVEERMGVFGSGQAGVLQVGPSQTPRWISPEGSFQAFAALSPDASWLAYMSDEGTGSFQIWLDEIDGEARRQVSNDGGVEPVWCGSCGELFFRQNNRILATRIGLESALDVGRPRVVFEMQDFVDTMGTSFDVTSDGQRAYYVRRSEAPDRDRIRIMTNWFQELEQVVTRGR